MLAGEQAKTPKNPLLPKQYLTILGNSVKAT